MKARRGAEERTRSSQFGFRPRRGTVDALALIGRMVDAASAGTTWGLAVFLLDWAKAFDWLKPECLCASLWRFGIPSPMVDMFKGIYAGRFLAMVDHCGCSAEGRRAVGIARGCHFISMPIHYGSQRRATWRISRSPATR